MSLSPIQQIHSLLEERKRILITFRKGGGTDAIASAVALSEYLIALGKRVDIVAHEYTLPEKLQFLKPARTIQSAFPHLKKFILSLDITDTGLKELSYDVQDNTLRIYITPQHGVVSKNTISTAQSTFTYDLIITLDTPDLDALGDLYRLNTELFFHIPIINIDHQSTNEQYGTVNLIEYTASTTAEVLFDLFHALGEQHISATIATALLTAMIDTTRSFTNDRVTPETLRIASSLMALGADRQYIVHNLYRTKTVGSLRLWGDALSHLESHKDIGLVSTRVSRDVFVQTGASEHALYDIVDELITYAPEATLVLVIHEHVDTTDTVHALLYATKRYDAKHLLRSFNPSGDKTRASVSMKGKTIREVEEKIIKEIRHRLKQA